MINRYTNRKIIENSSNRYRDYFSERDKKNVLQYKTQVFKFPTEKQLNYIPFIEHVWSSGDRLYKLAQRYLGDKYNWWVILRFNKIGSEMNIKAGDVMKIPVNLEDVLYYFL